MEGQPEQEIFADDKQSDRVWAHCSVAAVFSDQQQVPLAVALAQAEIGKEVQHAIEEVNDT